MLNCFSLTYVITLHIFGTKITISLDKTTKSNIIQYGINVNNKMKMIKGEKWDEICKLMYSKFLEFIMHVFISTKL